MADDICYGRERYALSAWTDAYHAFQRAERTGPLEPEDLERLGNAAFLIGNQLEYEEYFERLHRAHLDRGAIAPAARAAFWIGMSLMLRGEAARSNAWIARGQRLIENIDCVEHGHLLLPSAEWHLRRGEADLANASACAAVRIGERFGDTDLVACARHVQGRALIQLHRIQAGLALLDETMLAVVAGELSTIVTGLLYCSVITACRTVHSFGRAREWTAAFAQWCERQSEPLAYSGTCLVDRAEILRFQGAWPDAMAHTILACERALLANRKPPAAALYQRAEVHRLRREHVDAESLYRAASELGLDPQPGLSLLRLAEGQVDVACAAMRRTLHAATDRFERARLLPSHIEVLLAAGETDEARLACEELSEVAELLAADTLRASVAQAIGAIALAEGQPADAIGPLRRAFESWTSLEAPYEAARARVSIALACRALGDLETASLELAVARGTFHQLDARSDVVRVDALDGQRAAKQSSRLSPREQEVLRLIATGRTNRHIGAELHVSERTVDRHVSNILTKLGVPSRAAATAYAVQHRLL